MGWKYAILSAMFSWQNKNLAFCKQWLFVHFKHILTSKQFMLLRLDYVYGLTFSSGRGGNGGGVTGKMAVKPEKSNGMVILVSLLE